MAKSLRLALVALISLLTSSQLWAWSVEARQSLYGYSVEGKRLEARVMGVGLDVLTNRSLSSDLTFKMDAGLRLENGSHKSLDIAEFSPNQQVLLNEGLLQWGPIRFFEFKVGGINQRHLNSPLLIDEVVFIGASEKLLLTWGEYTLFLNFQQLVPNNRNLSTRLGSIDEGTPSFLSETLGLHLGGDLLSLKLEGSLFGFGGLSPSVAHQSRFLGNTVVGVSQDSAGFDTAFKGQNLWAELTWFVAQDFSFRFHGQYLHNRRAAEGKNQGQLLGLVLGWSKFKVGYDWYEIEADAAVAFYNDKYLGHTNRQGHRLNLLYHHELGDFSLTAVRTTPLRNNIFQAKSDLIALNYTHQFKVFDR